MGAKLLGIDIGTSACKIAVFDEDGTVISQTNESYGVYYPHPGYVEQDPNEWWKAIVKGIKGVFADKKVSPEDIKGIGVDGQSWSAIPVDRAGNVLYNTPIWMDTRARDICEKVTEKLGEDRIFNVAGNKFLPSYTTPKMLWFKENKPEIFEKTFKFFGAETEFWSYFNYSTVS